MEQTESNIFFLRRGDSTKLTVFQQEEDEINIEKITEIINKKKEEYKKYGLNNEILTFKKDDFTILAHDYFGYIKLPNGVVIKSDGDYLHEYEKKSFFIKQKDVDGIANNINVNSKKIKILTYDEPLRSGAYLLKSTSFVGVITLPSGFRIQIIPKINKISLYYILCYLYDIKISTFDESKYPQGTFFLDIIALIFKSELEIIIQQGLFKKYLKEEKNQNYLKGKLLIDMQIKHNFVNKHKLFCEYDELTYNNLENQTMLYALALLSELVFGDSLKQELVDLKWILETEVTLRKSLKVEEVEKISFSRLNDYYEKIISMSKQIIREIHIDDVYSKEIQAYGYLINMNILFQDFIFKIINDALPQYNVKGQEKGIDNLLTPCKNAPSIKLKPDILIYEEEKCRLSIDTKYKSMDDYYGSAKAKSPDIYQIVSYSLAYRCNGMLIYPKIGDDICDCYNLADNSENREIFVLTTNVSSEVELSKRGFDEFINKIQKELCSEIMKRLGDEEHLIDLEKPLSSEIKE